MKKRNNLKYIAGISTVIVMLLVCLVPAALAQTTISVQDASADVGMTTTAQIMVHGVADLGGFGITLSYDPAVVNVTGATNNPNLPDGFPVSDFSNAANGSVVLASSGYPLPSLSGDVLLTTVTLEAVGSAGQTSPLNIVSIGLVDSAGDDISAGVTAVNGTFTIMLGPTPTPTPTPTPGPCGPIDLVIVLDDTGSMGGAINSIKAELTTIIATANTASGGDLRMGYITFKDDVTVHNALTTDVSAVVASINAASASGGAGSPEASDEAKNTAVNNLPAGTRTDSAGNSGTQTGDFTTPYRAGAVKIVVLITDAPPGGFNDVQDPADDTAMHTHAVTAKSNGILISDVFVPTGGDYAGQAAILKDDADTTGGSFITTAADGTGTGDAIKDIIEWCGGAPPAAAVPLLQPPAIIALAGILGIIAVTFIVRKKTRR